MGAESCAHEIERWKDLSNVTDEEKRQILLGTMPEHEIFGGAFINLSPEAIEQLRNGDATVQEELGVAIMDSKRVLLADFS